MVNVGSVNTRYWMEGEGFPVVLIHGIGNCIEDWLLNIQALAAEHRVYAMDLIGHGKSDKPLSASYHFTDFAKFVISFMDSLDIPCADLIGHSLGGAISLIIAENYPDYVRRLVLIDSAGLEQKVAMILRLISLPGVGELMGKVVLQGDFEKRLKMQRESWPDQQIVPDEMIRLKYEATRWENVRKTYFKALRTNSNFWGMKRNVYKPIVRGLSSLKMPVLVVWGEQDDLLPVSHTQIIKDKVPGARVEIFENCKHDPMVMNPQRFNRLVLDFLKTDG
jgi:4,5:9,10-diseco-3-hydroxy-5,9,17-trioxoandrosta-1(10),2-diene-4-oate hydrolase